MTDGRDGCRGALAIVHKPINNPLETKTRTFRAANYRNTWGVFRRREITFVEVWGTCPWRLYPQRKFRGEYMSLRPGFSSSLSFLPKSIAQFD